ncbi:16S rRNA (cytidine(1402)-2'-O)-methyltransferase [Telmatospirillum sp. J64-1]|uniref:16S rRNA (cytidine(1402)-2'-O)-methyltransferase n=1 Tax=Telmatospirillum sp. J64-1 TaxID=2502183 RepID=UPI00115E0C5A|nr:16S rRNA (cytidine(1402)-2'-O)-methyltransferase [Telmatospirillum sp. J64-1]
MAGRTGDENERRDGASASSDTTVPGEAQSNGGTAGSKPAAGLYLVATPIGNIRDITLRALDVLAGADLVACEDTRVTAKLLGLLGLKAPLFAYHDHNADRAGPALLEKLRAGLAVALVSDAGTPLVSDPGFRLVRACVEEGIPVTSLPGPSAPLTALQLSGLPSDRFLFAGFLPNKSSARRTVLAELAGVPATLIFFESPHRLAESLEDMAAVLGGRDAAVARELTKLFEEVRRAPLPTLAAHYAEAGGPKGEVVVVVGPPGEAEAASAEDVDALLRDALADASVRDAAATVAAATGRPRREIYARALELAKERK